MRVRITLELESSFLNRLNAEVGLSIQPHIKEGAELAPSRLLAWLVFNEARGTITDQLAMSIPMMNRSDCPEVIADERRVYKDEIQISGPTLVAKEV